jgi:hypothetical protein
MNLWALQRGEKLNWIKTTTTARLKVFSFITRVSLERLAIIIILWMKWEEENNNRMWEIEREWKFTHFR